MKTAAVISFVFALSLTALAQQDAKVVAEVGSWSEAIKNSPFSAEAVSESVQTLFDGNRIVHNSTSKIYRNSEGRVRREFKHGSGGSFGSFGLFSPFNNLMPSVTIMDQLGSRYLLDSVGQTARKITTAVPQRIDEKALTAEQKGALEKLRAELKIVDGTKITDEQRAAIKKLKAELKITAPLIVTKDGFRALDGTMPPLPSLGRVTVTSSSPAVVGSSGGAFVYSASGQGKYDSKKEELGSRNIEGVDAEGTRTTTTIPAGAIGNERPIEIVYERWYSKDLGMVVYSRNIDPRFGEQTYTLKNIVRAEPDPSLFSLPSGYKVLTTTGDQGGQYDLTTVRVRKTDATSPAKSGQTVITTTTVAKPKDQ